LNYDVLDPYATLEVISKITKQPWGYGSSLQGLDKFYLSLNPKCSNQDNDYYANTKPNDAKKTHMATDLNKHIKLFRGYIRDRDNLHPLNYIMFSLEIAAKLLSFHDSLQLGVFSI